jgi:hypothetical protein
MEDDLPESYADLARRVYKMAEKEGWSQQKVFELLKDPAKLVKTMEHVSVSYIFMSCVFRESSKASKNPWNLLLSACLRTRSSESRSGSSLRSSPSGPRRSRNRSPS